MALNASSKLRPKVIALQKRGVAVILQRTEAATANGDLTEKKARDVSCNGASSYTAYRGLGIVTRFDGLFARTKRHRKVALLFWY
jgi:hypothetical protein